MKTYMCDNCGFINQIKDFDENTVCSNCKATYDKLYLIENQIAENEIDAIINSVIENLYEEKDEKIINREDSEDKKYLEIDESNPCIRKNQEKCINCGQCKRTCEKNVNLRYDLNVCNKPICIGCGECIKNCPTSSIMAKEDYAEVKDVIDKNDKIVVAIIEPNIPILISNYYKISNENIDYKLNSALKRIGFDYVLNSGFSTDLNIVEEVSEFVERLKNKKLLPLISANCPSITKYLEIYHPEVTNNISTCKNPIFMQSKLVKEVFSKEKGFSSDKIITVGITTCISNKMKQKESNNNLDYVLTINELIKLIDSEGISISNLPITEYDDYTEFSNSSKLIALSGGQSEVFIKTFCKLVNKTKKSVNEIDESKFMNPDGVKEVNIKIADYQLRLAIVNSVYELDYLINTKKYKNYHYIEVKLNKNGCIGCCNLNIENLEAIKDEIYNNVNNYPFDNKTISKLYKSDLDKPLSPKSIALLHETYEDKSKLLSN